MDIERFEEQLLEYRLWCSTIREREMVTSKLKDSLANATSESLYRRMLCRLMRAAIRVAAYYAHRPPDEVDSHLHMALAHNLLHFTLDRGADVNYREICFNVLYSTLPLAEAEDEHTINTLLDHGANVYDKVEGRSILHIYALKLDTAAIRVIAQRQLDHRRLINAKARGKNTPADSYRDTCRYRSIQLDQDILMYLETGVWPKKVGLVTKKSISSRLG